MMGKTKEGSKKKKYLYLSLISNLGLLFLFKYFNFFSTSVHTLFYQFNIFYNAPTFKLLLPVGISFYTFQTLSYTIDVYRGKKEPEKNFGIFAVYVSFFPQLVAGPIERATNLLPQFYKKHKFDYDRVSNGLKLMLWGFFKKLVIADRLAILVNTVYNNPTGYTGLPLILATIFFAFQIYCDFSGYSDIAIGASQVLGYNLMDNFKRPYFSKSIQEFWQRWHISLSTWFKDYVYIPLGGNRGVKWRWYYNLSITFIISGLWHGANWTFLAWGAIHAFYIVFAILTKDFKTKVVTTLKLNTFPLIYKYTQILMTFSLVCFAWIFFRSNNIADALYIVSNIFSGTIKTGISIINFDLNELKDLILGDGLGLNRYQLIIAFISILFMETIHLIQRHGGMRHMLSKKPYWFRMLIYYLLILLIMFFGIFQKSQFIYFQF